MAGHEPRRGQGAEARLASVAASSRSSAWVGPSWTVTTQSWPATMSMLAADRASVAVVGGRRPSSIASRTQVDVIWVLRQVRPLSARLARRVDQRSARDRPRRRWHRDRCPRVRPGRSTAAGARRSGPPAPARARPRDPGHRHRRGGPRSPPSRSPDVGDQWMTASRIATRLRRTRSRTGAHPSTDRRAGRPVVRSPPPPEVSATPCDRASIWILRLRASPRELFRNGASTSRASRPRAQ